MADLKTILEDILTNGGSFEQERWRSPGVMETINAEGQEVCIELMHGDTGLFDGLIGIRPEDERVRTEEVDSYGGEDQGSEYYHIWKFTLPGPDQVEQVEYIRFDGCYASHYGTDYEGYNYVRPVEKTVIVYE
jgi:hypothetical protein